MTLHFVDKHKKDARFSDVKNPTVLASVEHAVRSFLPRGKGVELKCTNSLLSEKLGLTQLILPTKPDSNSDRLVVPEIVEEKSSLEDLQFDFVFVWCIDRSTTELQRVFKESHRILKVNGVLVLAFFDPSSQAAEEIFGKGPEPDNAYRVEKIMFELSHCGFKQYAFRQTLCVPLPEGAEVQEPKAGYGEGLFVVVQARKKI